MFEGIVVGNEIRIAIIANLFKEYIYLSTR
jgi:hypothetical protein